MADTSVVNGRNVGGSGSSAGERPTTTVRPTQQNTNPVWNKYGLTYVPPGGNQDRAYFFAGIPDNEQPTVDEAKLMYANLPPEQAKQVRDRMDAYYGEGRWNASYVENFFGRAVDISAAAFKRGERVPVITALDNLLANFATEQGGGGAGGGGRGGAPRITASVNLTDPGTAETLIDQALQGYLGRRASEKEIRQFRKALTKAEMGAPTEVDIEGTTQITSGGFNPATFAQQYAEGMEGAAEYQAATTFLDAFVDSLGAKVDVV